MKALINIGKQKIALLSISSKILLATAILASVSAAIVLPQFNEYLTLGEHKISPNSFQNNATYEASNLNLFSPKLNIDAQAPDFPLSVCGNSDIVNVSIVHTGNATDTFKNVKVGLTAPAGIDFSDIVVIKNGPIMITGDTIMFLGDSLNNIGDSLIFSVRIKAKCNFVGASGDFIVRAKFKPIGIDSVCTDMAPILVNRADLSIPTSVPAVINAYLGKIDSVTVTVANAGNGPLDSFYYCVSNNNPSATIQQVKVNGVPLAIASVSQPGFICFVTPPIGSNAILVVKEVWLINGCVTPAPILRRAQYGCEGNNDCQAKAQAVFPNTDLVFTFLRPRLVAEIDTTTRPACFTEVASETTIRIINTGTAPAKNIIAAFSATGRFVGPYTITYPGGGMIDTVREIKNLGGVGNCNGAPALISFTDTIKSTNLLPGDTLVVNYSTISNCACNDCSILEAYYTIMQVVKYTDYCDKPYTTPSVAVATPAYSAAVASFTEGPLNLSGSQTGVIEYAINGMSLTWFGDTTFPNAFIESMITLECGVDYIPGSIMLKDANGVTFPICNPAVHNDLGIGFTDTLTVRWCNSDFPLGFVFGPNTTLTFGIMGDCSEKPEAPNCSYSVYSSQITQKMDLVIDPTCMATCKRQKIWAADTFIVDQYCPKPGCIGASGTTCLNYYNFTVERINFGLGDVNNDKIADGTINPTLVQKDRFLQGDSLKATFGGFVNDSADLNNLTHGFAEMKWVSKNYTPLSAQVIIHDSSSNTTYVCNAVELVKNVSDSTLRVNFSPGSLNSFGCAIPGTFEFDQGDSISVCMYFQVKDTFVGLQKQVIVESDFFLSDNVFGSGNIFQCDDHRAFLNQMGLNEALGHEFNQFGACDIANLSVYNQRFIGQLDFDEFPFEIRSLGLPKTITFTKPSQFEYVFDEFGTSLMNNLIGTIHSLPSGLIPSQYISINGANEFTFLAESYFTDLGLSSIPMDDGFLFNFFPKIKGSCRSFMAKYPVSYQFSDAVNSSIYCTPMLMSDVITDSVDYGGGAELIAVSEQSSVRLCSANEIVTVNVINTSAFDAPNAFIYPFSPTGGLTISQVVDLSNDSVLVPNQFGIIAIPDVPSLATRKFDVYVTANTCKAEKIGFIAGWDCDTLPTTVDEALCSDPSFIDFTTAQAGLNIDILSPATDLTIPLCDTVPYTIQIRSTDLGYLRDIVISAAIPRNQDPILSSFRIAIPSISQGGTFMSIPPPTIIPGGFSLNVSMQDSILRNIGLVGSKDVTKNTVDVTFKTVTRCGYISGSRLVFTARANNTCGNAVPRVIKPSKRLRVPVANPNFAVKMKLDAQTVNPCNEDTITSALSLQLTTNSATNLDSIAYTLAPGIFYVPGSYIPLMNATPNPPSVSTVGGIQRLVWPFNTIVPFGATVKFSVRLSTSDVQQDCAEAELVLQAYATRDAMCGMTSCKVGALAGEGSQLIRFIKPKLEFVNFDASIMVNPANTSQTMVNTDIKIINNGATLESGDSIRLELYEDRDFTGTHTPDDTLAATLVHVLTSPLGLGQCVYFMDTILVQSGLFCTLIGVMNPLTTCTCDEEPSNQLQLKLIQKFTKDTFFCSSQPVPIGTAPIPGYGYQWLSYNGSPISNLTDPLMSSTDFTATNTSGAIVEYQYILRTSLRGCYSYDTVTIQVSPEVNDVANVQACINSPYNLPLPPQVILEPHWTLLTGLSFTGPDSSFATITNVTINATYTLNYLDELGCPASYVVNVSAIDCGTALTGLGDTVWFDFDKDGLQEPGEPGIAGVKVNLYNGLTNTLVSTTFTDANGRYSFDNLPPGTYFVEFVTLPGFITTTQNTGPNDTIDSDAGINGRTGNYLLPIGTYNPTVDAGFIPDCDLIVDLTVSDCIPTDSGLVRKIQTAINWSGDPYTYDQFFGTDTLYVSVGGINHKIVIDTLFGDTTLCTYMKFTTTQDVIASAYLFYIPECSAKDTVKNVTPCVYDLALKKTNINSGPFQYGDTVKFSIIVFNQGSLPAYGITVSDSLPGGYVFLNDVNPSWGDAGSNIYQTFIPGPLAAGSSDTLTLSVLLQPSSFSTGWNNYAEITSFRNQNNVDVSAFDKDSKPDNIFSNDAGGMIGSPADNYLDGNGTGVVGNGIAATDEDDHDGANVAVFDLAIFKQIDTLGTIANGTDINFVRYGDTIKFIMVIENQGNLAAQSFSLTDYKPAGYTFISGALNTGWSNPTTPTITVAATLRPWQRDTACIYLLVNSVQVTTANRGDSMWTNRVEISAAIDTSGVNQSLNDADYPLNNNRNDNVGGEINSPADDYLNGDGTSIGRDPFADTDQDNEDPAGIIIYDIALRKIVTPGSRATAYGDTVKFNLQVFNQGNQPIDSFVITDSLPLGLAFDVPTAALAVNAGWVLSGNEVTKTIKNRLLPGRDTTIMLALKVLLVTDQSMLTTAWTNLAEISNAYDANGMSINTRDVDSPLNGIYADNAGGATGSGADNYVEGNGTGIPGDTNRITDLDNADPALVTVADLALRKIIADTLGNAILNYGDTIKFAIQIFNQGGAPVDSILITDSIPGGFAFFSGGLNTGWFGAGPDVTYRWGLADTLMPGESDTICIYLRMVMSTPSNLTTWTNRAEISAFFDTNKALLTDVDSRPDVNQSNDAGGNLYSGSDDAIDGNGTGVPGDTSRVTDEDDEDPAALKVYDIALSKIITPGSVALMYNDTIKFNLTITNQGNQPIDSFVLIDSLPTGLVFDASTAALPVNAGWTLVGNEVVQTVRLRLIPGASTTVMLALKVILISDLNLLSTAWINLAEISAAYDTLGLPIVDIDSPLNDIYLDNAGGAPLSGADNYILGNGTGVPGDTARLTDQDNADPAFVPVNDLALRKIIVDTLGNTILNYGDTIKFAIQLFNQGGVKVDSIIITDSIPAGFAMVAGPLNAGWFGSGPDVTYRWGLNDTLIPGESDTICIYLRMQMASPASATDWINRAEISASFDTNKQLLSDIDSRPDNNQSNDPGGNLNTGSDNSIFGNGTGMRGDTSSVTDEDDDDPAGLLFFDLALKKVLNPASVALVYPDGTDVTYDITVTNQGPLAVDSIQITDYVPCGLDFLTAIQSVAGWTFTSPLALYTIKTRLLPGQSLIIPFVLRTLSTAAATSACGGTLPLDYLTNVSEISMAWDTLGMPLTEDIDSKFDQMETNDAGGSVNTNSDNVITGDGTGVPLDEIAATDEDDQDPGNLQVFDLALKKEIITPGPYLLNSLIQYDITVYNQGNVPVTKVSVVDYIPAGLSYSASDNLINPWLPGPGTNQVQDTIFASPDTLQPTEDTTISIFLRIANTGGSAVAYTNVAEITSGTAIFINGVTPTAVALAGDGDSPFDNNQNNDAGGMPNSAADNFVLGNGLGAIGDGIANTDEDDQDPAKLDIIDLALSKKIAPGSQITQYGDTIKFVITISNQGTVPIDSFEITDSIPAGFKFVNLPINSSWALLFGNKATTVVKGRLAPWQDTSICIALEAQAISDFSMVDGGYTNLAEISAAYDTLGIDISNFDVDSRLNDNLSDNAGGQEDSPADDYVDGNGTGVIGDGVDSTDQDNADPALVKVVDLAMRKIVADTITSPLSYGDTVKYAIQIFNQGSVPIDTFAITDSLPNGLSFINGTLNSGWTPSGLEAIYGWGTGDILMPGESDTICIYLRLEQVGSSVPDYTNRAEISFAGDTTGTDVSAIDVDGPLNDNYGDNAGGQPESGADDAINGDGTGVIGDGVDSTDADQGDPAFLRIVDLAMNKTIDQIITDPLSYGDTIKFKIAIFNQGNVPIDTLAITDSIPNGFTFIAGSVNMGWTASGAEAVYGWGSGDTLMPGESDTLCIYLTLVQVESGIPDYTNRAEISFAADTAGTDVSNEDIDGPLNDNYADNAGGQEDSPADDYVDGNGTGVIGDGVDSTDQDNADPALVKVVDLAMRKIVADTITSPLSYGDTVKYAIQIFNQGSVPIDTFAITDSLPNGLSFINGTLNSGWTPSGLEAIYGWGTGDILMPGESDTICIYLRLEQVGSSVPDYTNRAEISFAGDTTGTDVSAIDVDGPLNDNYGDNAGGQPESGADDAINGDGTGVIGDGVDSTDADQGDPAFLRIVDLAMNKTIDQIITDPLSYGDTVKFKIAIFNQGNVPIDTLAITDSIPNGFTFIAGSVNMGWTASGAEAVYGWGSGDTLMPGESDTLCIYLTLMQVESGIPDYTNRAEISFAADTAGTDVSNEDIDGPLNDNYADNAGGQEDSPADDYVDGNGTGVIGDGVDSTDQDNADPALVKYADLALKKFIIDTLGDNILLFGDTVKLGIRIFNQGSVPVDSFDIIDSLPAGLEFVIAPPFNQGWTYTAPEAIYSWGADEPPLMPGDSVTICIYAKFQLASPATPKTFTNIAEISYFEDTLGIPLDDIDSSPDGTQSNDAGGEAKTPSDDAIFGNGSGMPGDTSRLTDEDDQDIVEIGFFDLALNKKIAPGSIAAAYGDTIKFVITIFNQGSIPADSIVITDSLPAGLMFDPANLGNAGWSLAGNKVKNTISGPGFLLQGMQDTSICIVLKAIPVTDPALRSGAWINYAEISAAYIGGSDLSGQDIDSDLDSNYGNNIGGMPNSPADDYIDGKGTGMIGDGADSTDQDNADPAYVNIADIALRKTIADTLGNAVLQYGDTIKYTIDVFNQGNVWIDTFVINDTLPVGLTFVPGPLNAGWTLSGNEVIYEYNGMPLEPTDTFTTCIYLQLTRVTTGIPDYVNRAEISYAGDTSGAPISDMDSPLDDNYGNNAGGLQDSPADDEIDGDGKGMIGDGVDSTDQDNADPAYLDIIDLALTKTISGTTPAPYSYGDTVKFDIKIVNQGGTWIDSFTVTDYIASGFEFDPTLNPGWTLAGTKATAGFAHILESGADTTICISLIVRPITDLTKADSAWLNLSEISYASDTTGNDVSMDDIDGPLNDDPGDNGGGGPNTPSDDELDGDGTGIPGDGVDSTDSDSHDPSLIRVVNLAMRKIIADTLTSPLSYGDTVKYAIQIFNQGNVGIDTLDVTDYLPSGLVFVTPAGSINQGWDATDPQNPVYHWGGDTLFTGQSDTICIWARVVMVTAASELVPNYTNFAEISFAGDTAGTDVSLEDADGPLNNIPGDNGGGQPDSPADDYVDGDGSGVIGDGVDSTDSDSHDPANLNIVDLAMIKTIAATTPPPFRYKDTVKFDIYIVNQGETWIDSFAVTDYIAPGFEFDPTLNPGWTLAGTKATAGFAHRLESGADTIVCIYLKIKPIFDNTKLDSAWLNLAEISFASDTMGSDVSMDDIDGPLNDDPSDNAGGQPESPADDELDGDGTGIPGDGVDSTDSDSHDPALVMILDLAHKKVLDPSIIPPFLINDTIKFQLQVFNQGNVPIETLTLTDSIPIGYRWDATLNPGWTGGFPKVDYILAPFSPLLPGESDTVCINLVIDMSPSNQGAPSDFFVNRSEISFIQDTSGNNTGNGTTEDADSKPDTDLSNDAGGQVSSPSDDAIEGDGTGIPGDMNPDTDEDDEDISTLEIIDIALLKQIDSTGTIFPLRYGASVKFKIQLENQGTVMLQNIKVVDYIPSGLEYDAAMNDPLGWVLTGDKAQITVPGQMFPWEMDTLCIFLKLKMQFPSTDSAWTNRAEVYEVTDPRGTPRTDDVDSPLNDNPHDNPGGKVDSPADDFLSGDGSGVIGDGVDSTDQDNADPAQVKVYDLALKKTTSLFVVQEGDIVPFIITVYNQGNEPMDTIKITDYIPSAFAFNSGTGWTLNGANACYTIPGPLNPGDSLVLPVLNLKVDNPATNLPEGLYNYAEVSDAKDTTGVTPPDGDIDSNWDTDPDNDSGGDLFNDDDNNLTEDYFSNPQGDEDDHDGAFVIVCKGYVCDDKVNVSLDENCSKTLTALDLLVSADLPPHFYDEVSIKDASGKLVPGATFTREHLGYCFTYSVSASVCGANSCWGTVCVEDKAPPAIDCTPDTITCFELAALPSGNYSVKDNCSGLESKVLIAAEQYYDYGCDSVLQGRVVRRLIATDPWNNTIDCQKIYYIEKIDIADIVCPRDTSADCNVAGSNFGDPSRSGAPSINGIKLFPNNPACKISVSKRDDTLDICGAGYKILRTWTIADWCTGKDTTCVQTIKVEDRTAPIASSITYPTKIADPHDCRAKFELAKLTVSDCSPNVTQRYFYNYTDESGITRIVSGTLPATVWVGNGLTKVLVVQSDECLNTAEDTIFLTVIDATPPTPVCDEFTQVTVDPESCWTVVLAKDLDNGSHDNCVKDLHFAVARMSDIEKARKDYEKKIIDSCGSKEYWDNKAWHDAYIERWINCYVFDDSLHMDDCGSNQVVLRVYEADSMPRLDPHLWSCGAHEWFCYNTYPEFRIVTNAAKDCEAKAPWLCKTSTETWFANRSNENYAAVIGSNGYFRGTGFPQTRLYNDCMVQVLVDDKQAPKVSYLEDRIVYCDNVQTALSAYAKCEGSDSYGTWPGAISYKGIQHGYYGGSGHISGGGHGSSDEHGPVYTGCANDKWSPIYCRSWLLLDSVPVPTNDGNQAGKIDPTVYFDNLVLFDKNRPKRTLLSSEFSISDNCKLNDASLVVSTSGSLNSCGEGWFSKTWTIADKCGNKVTATQKVIVKHRSDFEVLFPKDVEVTCESIDATDTSKTGKPMISDDECEQVGLRYVDEISTVGTDGSTELGRSACYKIIRTWTLIDWCIYDANAHTTYPDVIVDDRPRAGADTSDRACIFRHLKDNGDGYMKYVQIIKVLDTKAPTLTCRDTTINITANCNVALSIPLRGTDNCSEQLRYRVEITRPDGSKEIRNEIQVINGTFTSGMYTVNVFGRDLCNNESTCSFKITIVDKKAPTPYCLNGVATVIMPSTGTLDIWAKDLNRASEDNCTAPDKLKFSFTKDVTTASRTVSCKDLRDGKEQALELEIWVTDEAGNQDLCRTYILLQDNGGLPGGVCKDTTVSFANITGRLYTEDQEGVEFAEVKVNGAGSAGIPSFKTKNDGSYSFASLPMNGISSIKALRDDNPMNGVSTLDLVLIQKHILGTESLKTPYKMIAADINSSDDITVVDLLELRKLILGIYDKLPANTSWKFVPKSHVFSDVTNPWGYPTEETIKDMKESMVRDFVGVKIGDVNGSAVPHSLLGTEVRNTETGLILEVEDQTFKAGDKVEVSFRSPNFAGVSGFQGTIQCATDNVQRTMSGEANTSYILNGTSSITSAALDMTDKNIGTRWSNEGLITMSWNTKTGIDIDSKSILFTMTFVAQKDGKLSEVMRIGSQRTKAESYEGKGELGNLSIRFTDKSGKEISGTNTLYQNYPNPFDQRTVIGMNLAQSVNGTLNITDITGRVIKSISRDWNKGYNEVWLDRREVKATGVLFYTFESIGFIASKKMIILE